MSRSTISTFQLFALFPNEETARTYLESRIWPDGVTCPDCHTQTSITTRRGGYYRCNACVPKLDFTVRTGTVMERSHVPLHKWLYSMYLVMTARKGISSMQLAKEIGITQKSAWFVLCRLREACGGRLATSIGKPSGPQGGRMKAPVELDQIADLVLNYRPKPKSKAARKRAKKQAGRFIFG